jgi:hypothetical protein
VSGHVPDVFGGGHSCKQLILVARAARMARHRSDRRSYAG